MIIKSANPSRRVTQLHGGMKSYNRRKVLLVGSLPPPQHGSNLYFQSLLLSDLRERFSISHLDLSDHRSLDNIGRLDFLNVYFAVRNVVNLAVLSRKLKPDLVYVPIAQKNLAYLRDGLLILASKAFSHCKLVIHLHGSDFRRFYENTNMMMRWFIRETLKRVDTAIVLSDRLRSIFEGLVENVSTVPNGIDFLIERSRPLKKKRGDVVVGYMGNLFRRKGVFDLLSAVPRVLEADSNVEFRFAGAWWGQETDLRRDVDKFITQHELQDRVKFVGSVDGESKIRFLTEVDIFVFPSWNEGSPLVILEAMATGCPVISTDDVGGIPDLVDDGVTGVLVEKENPRQIADAIMRLIRRPALRRKMGEMGRRKYLRSYTLSSHIQRMAEVFDKTMLLQIDRRQRPL